MIELWSPSTLNIFEALLLKRLYERAQGPTHLIR